MIDLHLHTTASDGRCAPEDLVERAFLAGIRVMSVTDHDTMAGVACARARAASLQIQVLPGIEITTVSSGRDVHVLAYDLAEGIQDIEQLLARQRTLRGDRARAIADKLQQLGAPIDIDDLLRTTQNAGQSIARPQIARALVDAGHVGSVAEAFERFLGDGCSAYVPHTGASPADVIALVSTCGGVASLAHPGLLKDQGLIPALVDAGLRCLEVFHSAHDEAAQAHYLGLARTFGLVCTGGSDYHGPETRRAEFFGRTNLPAAHFEQFEALLSGAHAS